MSYISYCTPPLCSTTVSGFKYYVEGNFRKPREKSGLPESVILMSSLLGKKINEYMCISLHELNAAIYISLPN